MIPLPNNCSCSEPALVKPKSGNGPWRVCYRFYDPTVRDDRGKIIPFHVNSKRINRYPSTKERLTFFKLQKTEMLQKLRCGYNPRERRVIIPLSQGHGIDPSTPFIQALFAALDRSGSSAQTIRDVRNYVLANCKKAAERLGYVHLQISEVRRKHIVILLDMVRQSSARFSDNTFNHYRKYLKPLFDELMELDAIDHNPVTVIRKKKVLKAPREVLTNEQRTYLDEYLKQKHPEFHQFLILFFHSGGRIRELLRLQGKDVDLEKQHYHTIVLKGRQPRHVDRTIPTSVIPLWQKALESCGADDFVFSKGLKPGPKQICADQITKRWTRIVKKELVSVKGKRILKERTHMINGKVQRITADFYSLKHLHTSEVVDQTDEQTAAAVNSHSSTAMVVNIYDTKQKQRQHEKLKGLNISFSKK